jgi:hypothetical protein
MIKISSMTPQMRQAMQGLGVQAPTVNSVAGKLLLNDEAYGASLYVAATQALTPEELASFDPSTIRMELQDTFKCGFIPYENFDRLMAMVTVLSTDLFYQDLGAFIEICNILSGNPPLANVFDPADTYEIAWSLAETDLLDTRDNEIEFSEEIRAYMGMMLQYDGFFSPPNIMKMAIMPTMTQPAEITDDAELLPAIIGNNDMLHQSVREMLLHNTQKLVRQITPITGPLDFN